MDVGGWYGGARPREISSSHDSGCFLSDTKGQRHPEHTGLTAPRLPAESHNLFRGQCANLEPCPTPPSLEGWPAE